MKPALNTERRFPPGPADRHLISYLIVCLLFVFMNSKMGYGSSQADLGGGSQFGGLDLGGATGSLFVSPLLWSGVRSHGGVVPIVGPTVSCFRTSGPTHVVSGPAFCVEANSLTNVPQWPRGSAAPLEVGLTQFTEVHHVW